MEQTLSVLTGKSFGERMQRAWRLDKSTQNRSLPRCALSKALRQEGSKPLLPLEIRRMVLSVPGHEGCRLFGREHRGCHSPVPLQQNVQLSELRERTARLPLDIRRRRHRILRRPWLLRPLRTARRPRSACEATRHDKHLRRAPEVSYQLASIRLGPLHTNRLDKHALQNALVQAHQTAVEPRSSRQPLGLVSRPRTSIPAPQIYDSLRVTGEHLVPISRKGDARHRRCVRPRARQHDLQCELLFILLAPGAPAPCSIACLRARLRKLLGHQLPEADRPARMPTHQDRMFHRPLWRLLSTREYSQ